MDKKESTLWLPDDLWYTIKFMLWRMKEEEDFRIKVSFFADPDDLLYKSLEKAAYGSNGMHFPLKVSPYIPYTTFKLIACGYPKVPPHRCVPYNHSDTPEVKLTPMYLLRHLKFEFYVVEDKLQQRRGK